MEIDDIVIATVTSIKPYALFLSFEDGSVGLCHISELSDSYIKDIESFGTIGSKMAVKIIDIDKNNGFLRVSYKKVPQDQKFNDHKKNDPKVICQNEDFTPLKEHLEGWINNTLNEIKEQDK